MVVDVQQKSLSLLVPSVPTASLFTVLQLASYAPYPLQNAPGKKVTPQFSPLSISSVKQFTFCHWLNSISLGNGKPRGLHGTPQDIVSDRGPRYGRLSVRLWGPWPDVRGKPGLGVFSALRSFSFRPGKLSLSHLALSDVQYGAFSAY